MCAPCRGQKQGEEQKQSKSLGGRGAPRTKQSRARAVAIYHLSAQVISRSAGRSSVAAAAYRCGVAMRDERTGRVHDYTQKPVDGWEVLAPAALPQALRDPAALWNSIEACERRGDAQLCREINLALPCALSDAQRREAVRDWAREQCVARGMVAMVAYHAAQGENPHAHVMLSLREIGPGGWGKKRREWNDRALLVEMRQGWERSANRALERAGSAERVDCRTLEAQGIDRPATQHLGPGGGHADRRAANGQAQAWAKEQAARLAEQHAAAERVAQAAEQHAAALEQVAAQGAAAARRAERAQKANGQAQAWRQRHRVRAWFGFDAPARKLDTRAQEQQASSRHAAAEERRAREQAERAKQAEQAARLAQQRAAETETQRRARRVAARERIEQLRRENPPKRAAPIPPRSPLARVAQFQPAPEFLPEKPGQTRGRGFRR